MKFFIGATAAAGVIALLFFLAFVAGLHKKIDVLVKIVCYSPHKIGEGLVERRRLGHSPPGTRAMVIFWEK